MLFSPLPSLPHVSITLGAFRPALSAFFTAEMSFAFPCTMATLDYVGLMPIDREDGGRASPESRHEERWDGNAPANEALVAVVRGDSNVKGTVTFEQASESSPTTVSWDITGNDANAKRGMHVHAFGDNTNGCTSAGPHCENALACFWFILD